MRQMMVPGAHYGICASEASVALLERWGLRKGCGVVAPIVSAWDAPPSLNTYDQRPFDVILAGGINDSIKGVLFFAEVVERLSARGHRLRVRVTGKGPQRDELAARLEAAGAEARFDGALQPADMPDALGSAKVLVFPSRQDAWGLVANEAVLCGTPVLGSPHATSSPYFVERFGVGLVRPLDVDAWCDALVDMLSGSERWSSFMARREAPSPGSARCRGPRIEAAFDPPAPRVQPGLARVARANRMVDSLRQFAINRHEPRPCTRHSN